MKVFNIKEDFSNIPKFNKPINLCLGYFDAVHIAHQKLINTARVMSDIPVGIITFTSNVKGRKNLTSLESRLNIFKQLNIDYVLVLPFSKKIQHISYIKFKELFFDKLNVHKYFTGEDFTFGKDKKGTVKYLSKFYKVHVVSFMKKNNKKISSFDIANLIKNGRIEEANKLLGRTYQIKGRVVKGFKNGRRINFPTANIKIGKDFVIPKYGVYKVIVYVLGVPYLGVANVGVHPTINKLNSPLIEVHITNFNKDIYKKEIYVEFVSFVREEKKFKSIDELKKQIATDIKRVKLDD